MVGRTHRRQNQTLHAETRLNHVRIKFLAGLRILIFKILAGFFAVIFQIEIRPVSQSAKLFCSEWKFIFEINGSLRIMRQLFFRNLKLVYVFQINAQIFYPLKYLFPPHFEIFTPVVFLLWRFDEVLNFHLLEFSRAVNKITGSNFVPERLADLSDPERQLFSRGIENIFKIDENALRGFRPEINFISFIFSRAQRSFKH